MLLNYLLLSFLQYISITIAQNTVTPTAYSINWNSVPTSAPSTNYQQDIGTCLCDLTLDMCDSNCCCDTDCSYSQKASFFKGGCLIENYGNASALPYCSSLIYKVNRASSMDVSVSSVDDALCVASSNSPIKGNFYSNVGTFESKSLFLERFRLDPFPIDSTSYNLINSYIAGVTTYKTGDAIKIRYPFASLDGSLLFPRSLGFSSSCSLESVAKFGVAESSSCSRVITTPATDCSAGTFLDLGYYTKGFSIYTKPLTSTFITPTLRNVYCYDSTTGVKLTCASTAATWNAATGICTRTLIKLNYDFIYTINSTLSQVALSILNVDVTYSDLPLKENDFVQQSFEISYTPSWYAKPYDPIEKSGNPGYINGKPVLAGSKTSSNGKSAILLLDDPEWSLSLASDFVAPGATSLTCSGTTDRSHRMPLLFGQDMVSYCTLTFTLAQMSTTANCASIRQSIYQIQTLTASNINYIGKFGNSSFENIFDWVPVINEPLSSVTGDTVISEITPGTCTYLLTEFDIQVLYSEFGSIDNPQKGIVGVRYNYVPGSISYQCIDPLQCADTSVLKGSGTSSAGTNAQSFRIKSTVSFVEVATDKTTFVPPPPRLVPPLPEDVFYPFNLK